VRISSRVDAGFVRPLYIRHPRQDPRLNKCGILDKKQSSSFIYSHNYRICPWLEDDEVVTDVRCSQAAPQHPLGSQIRRGAIFKVKHQKSSCQAASVRPRGDLGSEVGHQSFAIAAIGWALERVNV